MWAMPSSSIPPATSISPGPRNRAVCRLPSARRSAAGDLVPAPARPFGGSFDAYVVRINAVGTPTYSTYIGGSGNDLLEAVAVDKFGNIFATGTTRSANFPVVNGLAGQSAPAPG